MLILYSHCKLKNNGGIRLVFPICSCYSDKNQCQTSMHPSKSWKTAGCSVALKSGLACRNKKYGLSHVVKRWAKFSRLCLMDWLNGS